MTPDEYNTLRIILAAVIGPMFWAVVMSLLEARASRRASSDRRRREESLQRAYRFGRKLARLLRHR